MNMSTSKNETKNIYEKALALLNDSQIQLNNTDGF